MAEEGSGENELKLPADTLALLQEFYVERDAREKQFEDLKAKAEHENGLEGEDVTMDFFEEDWQSSQFWYSDQTALTLAEELLRGATHETRIAIVSAPSAFVQVKKILTSMDKEERPQISLLEFDERFAVFKEFVKYDYANPFRLPGEVKGSFDRIMIDPPFLTEHCQTQVALTVRWLSRPAASMRLIACTGAVMEPLILRLYSKNDMRVTMFLPQHSKGLSNEFRCFANFESDVLG